MTKTEEIENLNISKESKLIIRKLPTKRSPGPAGLTGHFYHIVKQSSHQFFTKSSSTEDGLTFPIILEGSMVFISDQTMTPYTFIGDAGL